MSWTSADAKEFPHLREYGEIERYAAKRLVEDTDDSDDGRLKLACVRLSTVDQLFYAMIPAVIEQKKFPLSINENDKFAPVDLNDVSEGVYKCAEWMLRGETLPAAVGRKSQIYNLTGPQSITAHEIVESLNRACNLQVSFKHMTKDEMRDYLMTLVKSTTYQRVQRQEIVQLERQVAGRSNGNCFHVLTITKLMVDTLLECFDWISRGEGDWVTKDLEDVLRRKPRSVETFFRDNCKYFRGEK